MKGMLSGEMKKKNKNKENTESKQVKNKIIGENERKKGKNKVKRGKKNRSVGI